MKPEQIDWIIAMTKHIAEMEVERERMLTANWDDAQDIADEIAGAYDALEKYLYNIK